MPELPEVELVCRQLASRLLNARLAAVVIREPRLRWPIEPITFSQSLSGKQVCSIFRRAKYMIMHFKSDAVPISPSTTISARSKIKQEVKLEPDSSSLPSENGFLINHLGMSGSFKFLYPSTRISQLVNMKPSSVKIKQEGPHATPGAFTAAQTASINSFIPSSLNSGSLPYFYAALSDPKLEMAPKLVKGEVAESGEIEETTVPLMDAGPSSSSNLTLTQEYDALRPWKHEHIDFIFESNFPNSGSNSSSYAILRYKDPRRFGSMHYWPDNVATPLPSFVLFKELGVEPLSDEFSGESLLRLMNPQSTELPSQGSKLRSRQHAIKVAIMDASIVVGVGNIYASESLFLSGIRPTRVASSLSLAECNVLAKNIKLVLATSIERGGSSLRDYSHTNGESGSFQDLFFVYGRETLPCKKCGSKISQIKLGQRSSFFCPSCQPNRAQSPEVVENKRKKEESDESDSEEDSSEPPKKKQKVGTKSTSKVPAAPTTTNTAKSKKIAETPKSLSEKSSNSSASDSSSSTKKTKSRKSS